jgi:hypothetical protein
MSPETLSIKLAWLEVSAFGNIAIFAVIALAVLFAALGIYRIERGRKS